jgi:hypothetical protein
MLYFIILKIGDILIPAEIFNFFFTPIQGKAILEESFDPAHWPEGPQVHVL